MDLFVIVGAGIGYNFVLLLFIGLALILHKHRWGVFICGVVLQGISVFGCIVGMMNNPEIWMTENNIWGIICSIILVIAGYFAIKHKNKKVSQQTSDI